MLILSWQADTLRWGGTSGLDGTYRKFISVAAKCFAQILFTQTRKTTDPCSGFFLFRKDILKGVKLQPRGFKILIEILMRSKYNKVSQIPYTFLPRKNGESKATASQGMEFLKHLWFLFKTVPEAGRFYKFCLVGGSGVMVNLGLLFILVEYITLSKDSAWAIAITVSIISNFLLNSVFTYSDKKAVSNGENIQRLIYYYLLSLVVITLNFIIYKTGTTVGFHYMIAALMGILFSTLLSFFVINKLFNTSLSNKEKCF